MTDTFATLLRRYRTEAGQTLGQLARASKCDTSYLSRVESERRVPSRDLLLRICDALGLTPEHRTRLTLAAGHAPDTVDPEMIVWLVASRAAVGAGEREAAA